MVARLAKLEVSGRTEDYYLAQVAQDRHAYYAGEGEAPGVWAGKGAELLGLCGQVDGEAFSAVLANRHPTTGERLKRNPNTKVLGIDVTFNAPKSASVLYALSDEWLRAVVAQAQEAAARAAVAYAEDEACVARFRADGTERRPGLGLVVGLFTQRLSREGDPHLHTHGVLTNFTQTGDGRASALDAGLIWRHCRAMGAVYDGTLRAELSHAVGVRWEQRNGEWEIAGIPAQLCQMWSKRRAQIQAKLDEWGCHTPTAAQAAAYNTRKRKADLPHCEDLYARWREEAVAAGWDVEQIIADLYLTIDQPQVRVAKGLSDVEVVETLLGPEGLTEKASGFGRRDVLVAAERLLGPAGVNRDRLNRIADLVLGDERVLHLLVPAQRNNGEVLTIRDERGCPVRRVCTQAERRYTTVELVEAELEVLRRVEAGCGAGLALVSDEIVERVLPTTPVSTLTKRRWSARCARPAMPSTSSKAARGPASLTVSASTAKPSSGPATGWLG
jgi:conjugative relaxase-like TrwC/TraI family protein